MDTALKITEINKSFYIRVADHFNITRQYSWRGWEKLFKYFEKTSFYPESFLDLGCGNGRFVEAIKNSIKGKFKYLGIDNNKYLIRSAIEKYKSENAMFKLEDIFQIDKIKNQFDLVTIFGVFHHIPTDEMRLQLLRRAMVKLSPTGKIVFTVWNFKQRRLFEKRLKNHEIELLGIDPKSINIHDYFLRWSDNSNAVRYCHYYTKKEILSLVKKAGMKIEFSYNADGANGKTNTYFVISPF